MIVKDILEYSDPEKEKMMESLTKEDYNPIDELLKGKDSKEVADKLSKDPKFVSKWLSQHKPWTRIKRIRPNDLCPCGSGLKYKKCKCEEYHTEAIKHGYELSGLTEYTETDEVKNSDNLTLTDEVKS